MSAPGRRKGIALAACVVVACLAAPLAATWAWDRGAPGVVALFVVALATGATAVAACLQFDPDRLAALRARPAGERLVRRVLAVPLASAGLGLVTGATVAAWERGTTTWRPPAPALFPGGRAPTLLWAGGLALLVLACAVTAVGAGSHGPGSTGERVGSRGSAATGERAGSRGPGSTGARAGRTGDGSGGPRSVGVLVLVLLAAPILVPATLAWCLLVAGLLGEGGGERPHAARGPGTPEELVALHGGLDGSPPAAAVRAALLRQLVAIGYEPVDAAQEGWIVARPATLFESWDLRGDGPHRLLPVIALRVDDAPAGSHGPPAEGGSPPASLIAWDLGAVGPGGVERTLWPGWLAAMVLLPAISGPPAEQ